jgi:hypothetical protein
MKIEFSRHIFEKCSNFMKIGPMLAAVFDMVDRQADMAK